MRKILSCDFNPDTACVGLCMEDGTMLSIDCTAMENEVANSMYQRSELDWLIYNDPLAYAELILNGDPELYLKAVTKKTPDTKNPPEAASPRCASDGFFTSYQSKQIQRPAVLRSILTSAPEAFSVPRSRKQVHLLRQTAETA